MLIESVAYASRWRRVLPDAKLVFALAGLIAAYLATRPLLALAVAVLYAALAVLAGGVRWLTWLRIAVWPMLFLAVGSLSLLVSIAPAEAGGPLASTWQWAPDAGARIGELAARSLAALSALLFLVLTTPLSDLIAVLRRWRCPDVLLDLMLLAYRMLFVLATVVDDGRAAQRARLGDAGWRNALRSTALLAASLAVQLWQRAGALHLAALARNADGPLRVLGGACPTAARDRRLAWLASAGLLLAVGLAG